jgi:hypothetical protein
MQAMDRVFIPTEYRGSATSYLFNRVFFAIKLHSLVVFGYISELFGHDFKLLWDLIYIADPPGRLRELEEGTISYELA